jgi:hypothetical protein
MLLQRRRSHVPALLLASVLTTAVAPQAFADNKAAAEQLYMDAKTLMEAGKAAEACPKLEESMRLEPADGTELRLATCYEMVGRWATSWGLYRTALTKAKKTNNAQRIEFATTHLALVEPKVSKVTLVADAGANVPGLVVKLDQDEIGAGAFGTAIPADPGPHKLVVSAPGKKPYETAVTVVGEGQGQTVKIPVLEDAPVSAPPESTSSGPGALPWIIGGAGVAFLGATIVSRIQVSSAQTDRQDACASQHTLACDDTGVSKIHTWDRLSYAFAGLAVVGIGVSIVMFTTSGSKGASGNQVGAGPATIAGAPGFQLQGSF